ncbi:type II toxin-antitoxin system RelE/ParE family toxin [Roseospira goensis]|uniref:Plasmid stabilization system protein ParE n=1 Tax=Roseospira goensis TaxID=391922 RepID=A0A7W6RZY8_9PROT|nr:type II toxin-antitoxin system RelE/ParE family toxin [Roseospira goensis]MBB4286341.1 plasmid stabilization system protein ParE [Roseospira goensis]
MTTRRPRALIGEIDAKVSRLPETPRLSRAGRAAGTREMVVRRRYVVVYRHDDDGLGGTAVTVLRVLPVAQPWP